MKASKNLSLSDMRRLIRLANELHDRSDSSEKRNEHLLKSLIDLTRARSGFMGVLKADHTGFFVLGRVDGDNPSTNQQGIVDRYLNELSPANPALSDTMKKARSRIDVACTQTRRQAVEDGAWYASAHVREYRKPLRIDDVICSTALTAPDVMSVLVIDQSSDGGGFSDRDRQLVNLLHSEIGWLFRQEISSAPFPGPELRVKTAKSDMDRSDSDPILRHAS